MEVSPLLKPWQPERGYMSLIGDVCDPTGKSWNETSCIDARCVIPSLQNTSVMAPCSSKDKPLSWRTEFVEDDNHILIYQNMLFDMWSVLSLATRAITLAADLTHTRLSVCSFSMKPAGDTLQPTLVSCSDP